MPLSIPQNVYIVVFASVGTDAVKTFNVFMYIGVGVGWQRRRETCQSLRELDNRRYFSFFLLAVTMMVTELDHVVRGGEPRLRTRGMVASRSVKRVRHPRGSHIVNPLLSLEWPHQETK